MSAGAALDRAAASAADGGAAPGRIGPNAITRIAEAVAARLGAPAVAELFAAAGLSPYLAEPPSRMVDEREVTRLHAVLRARLGNAAARELSIEAGRLTGDYLLAHRIPQPMCWLLRKLPAALASRVLLAAVSRHAWTFAGSGRFRAVAGRPVRLSIEGCPICRGAHADEPLCEYYAATFERLYRALVHPRAVAVQVACEAAGADACGFELRW
jgi:divinyl protochlorophyllide a 8-vinyl-reductase